MNFASVTDPGSMRPLSAQLIKLALGLLCAAALGACGPGVGGSGTGIEPAAQGVTLPAPQPVTTPSQGATPASLCRSALASALACGSAAPGVPPVPSAPSAPSAPTGGVSLAAPLWLADRPVAPRVQARIEGDRLDLQAPCARLLFSGPWAQLGAQPPRFHGALDDGRVATVEARAEGNALWLTLRDGAGTVWLGPVRLQPVAGPQGFGGCG